MTDFWILCVDDNERLLSGLERQLGLNYDVATATSGPEGLALLGCRPNCAAVISDMRMPHMNGAAFLAEARRIAPDTTRLLLTGYDDIADTAQAVNDGGIFRLLTKPVQPDALLGSVAAGVRQWELVRSERVLLEETLDGAARALIEALEIASPSTFARSRRVESGCRHVATELGIEPVWEIALAGLLMRVGWISLPSEVIDERLAGHLPTDDHAEMLHGALATTVRLIERIPRLDGVARIIADVGSADAGAAGPGSVTSASVVRAVADFDDALRRGIDGPTALAHMASHHDHATIAALRSWRQSDGAQVTRQIKLAQLTIGMIAVHDIVTPAGNLLVKAGSELTETVIQRLRNFDRSHGVVEPIVVTSSGG